MAGRKGLLGAAVCGLWIVEREGRMVVGWVEDQCRLMVRWVLKWELLRWRNEECRNYLIVPFIFWM